MTKRSSVSSNENAAKKFDTDNIDPLSQNDADDIDLGLDDVEASLFGRWRKKHRKHKKKKKKKGFFNKFRHFLFGHKKNYGKLQTSQNDMQTAEQQSNENIDNLLNSYADIKSAISPNQEEDITRFIQNINTPPKMFNFDVDSYLVNNPTIDGNNGKTMPATVESLPRVFYQFADDALPLGTSLNSDDASPSNLKRSNELPKVKRDLMTQRLDNVYNKIKMFRPLRVSIDLERNEDMEKRSSLNEKPSDGLKMHADENDNLVAEKSLADCQNAMQSAEPLINTKDLDIDLDLEKKFRDFNWLRKEPLNSENLLMDNESMDAENNLKTNIQHNADDR